MELYLLWLVVGLVYGFVIGLIPVAGASTGLILLFPLLDFFRQDPYLLVVFTTAIVVSSTIGDSFASILMNIPGAGGSAATMVDGFPLAKQGQGSRALSAAITTSTINGLLFGVLALLFLPYYAPLVISFGIPELFCFLLLGFSCVVFIANDKWVRSILGVFIGIFVGMIGQDPTTLAPRFTFGWEYLGDGVQMLPVLAGVLAFPELLEAYSVGHRAVVVKAQDVRRQIWQGIKDSFIHWWDGLRGGIIGAAIGMLPGVGGAVADWIAYSQTVAWNKKEKIPFGEGNIKGVIGCEGANNAQKASGYIPTVLFGIPAAPFEAIIMSLFIVVGLELGTPQLLKDMTFFSVLNWTYMISMLVTVPMAFLLIRYVHHVFKVPFKVWFWILTALLVWSCVQYTGYWQDYAILAFFVAFGVSLKYLGISRASFIIGFVLSHNIEKVLYQYQTLFKWYDVFIRPISLTLFVITCAVIIYGIFFNKSRITYT